MRHTLSSLTIEEGALVQSLEEKKNILSNYSRDKEMLKGKHDRVARQVRGKWVDEITMAIAGSVLFHTHSWQY